MQNVNFTIRIEAGSPGPHISNFSLPQYLQKVERKLIERALEQTKGNQTKAAKLLKIPYRSLRYRLETLGIPKAAKLK